MAFPGAMQRRADHLDQPFLDPYSWAARISLLEDGWVWGQGPLDLIVLWNMSSLQLQLELSHVDLEKIYKRKPILHFGILLAVLPSEHG